MIMDVYLTFLGISLFSLFLYGFTKQQLLGYLGTILLFILSCMLVPGINLVTGRLEYHSGAVITTAGTTITVIDSLTTYTNMLLGFVLAIISVWLFVMVMLETKVDTEKGKDYEEE